MEYKSVRRQIGYQELMWISILMLVFGFVEVVLLVLFLAGYPVGAILIAMSFGAPVILGIGIYFWQGVTRGNR